MSNKNLKEKIDDFLKKISIFPFSLITETLAFPKTYVLVTLTYKAYKDHKNERLTLSMRHGYLYTHKIYLCHFEFVQTHCVEMRGLGLAWKQLASLQLRRKTKVDGMLSVQFV